MKISSDAVPPMLLLNRLGRHLAAILPVLGTLDQASVRESRTGCPKFQGLLAWKTKHINWRNTHPQIFSASVARDSNPNPFEVQSVGRCYRAWRRMLGSVRISKSP